MLSTHLVERISLNRFLMGNFLKSSPYFNWNILIYMYIFKLLLPYLLRLSYRIYCVFQSVFSFGINRIYFYIYVGNDAMNATFTHLFSSNFPRPLLISHIHGTAKQSAQQNQERSSTYHCVRDIFSM